VLHIRLYPTDEDEIPEYVVVEVRAKVDDLPVQWGHTPLGRAARDGAGWILSTQLADDPDDAIREARQLFGVAKWVSLHRPHEWVQVWDDDGLVEGTFGPLSLFGGVATGDHGYDDAQETRLAEEIAKCVLPGLDLGFPPGLDAEVLDALDRGVGERAADPVFVKALVAAVNRAAKLRRTSATELLSNLFDVVDADVLRAELLHKFQDHQPPVRKELARILEFRTPPEVARRTALDLLYSSPKNQALDDAAAAVLPFLEHPEVEAELAEVIAPEGPPRPGTRVEAMAADLLLRRPGGAKRVARRARADRAGEPMLWWAVRKLLERPHDDALPTIALYLRAPTRPSWLTEAVEAASLALPAGDEATLLRLERELLGE
jgi:hypothetical protein